MKETETYEIQFEGESCHGCAIIVSLVIRVAVDKKSGQTHLELDDRTEFSGLFLESGVKIERVVG